jgi:hypothetical protein
MKILQQRLAGMLGALMLIILLVGTLVVGSIIYGVQQRSGAVHINVGQSVLAAGTLRRWDCREHLLLSKECPPIYGVWFSAPAPPLGRMTTTMLLEIPASIVFSLTGRAITV